MRRAVARLQALVGPINSEVCVVAMSSGRSWRRLPWKLRYDAGARAASEIRRLAIVATHQHCRVEFQGPVRLGPGFRLRIPDHGTLIVGHGVDFREGFVCEISGEGRVTIGAGSIFTSHALLQCSTSIDIGRRCVFGQSLMIADGNHRYRDPNRHLLDQGYDFRPIRIDDRAMVTTKCTILNNIGEGAVIGANSVVTAPIPPFCLAVGAPARVVDYFGPPGGEPPGFTTEHEVG
jgi:acetyltransferase-like isoleucine patch superfamily enzyme